MAKLGLDIDQSNPFSSFIFISIHDDSEFRHHFGLAKGLLVVCGEEKVKTKEA